MYLKCADCGATLQREEDESGGSGSRPEMQEGQWSGEVKPIEVWRKDI